MAQFTFKAPALFEAATTAADTLDWVHHDSPEVSEQLAKHKRFAFWLKSKMDEKGLDASNPHMGEGGWMITLDSGEGFILCIVSSDSGGEKPFDLLVTEIGGYEEDCLKTTAAIEAILSEAEEVEDLEVDRNI